MPLSSSSEEDVGSRTIVGVPLELPRSLTPLVITPPEDPQAHECKVERRLFKVRLADSEGRRNSAGMLINKMYSWRGYDVAGPTSEQPNRITLVASDGEVTISTITVGLDSPIGLLADDLYKVEIDRLRNAGLRVCEFTKLAVDHGIRSKRALGSIFHIACIYARRIHGHTDLVIEVNPRHVKFYERMLGFVQYGPERSNMRVNAPAVLLRLEFSYLEAQIEAFGGRAELAVNEKSLYPYFFSPAEAAGIAGRLTALK